MTCTTPGPHHNFNATRANQMGGSTRGAHKTIPPAQCGNTPNHMPQKAASQQYLAWRASGFQGPAPKVMRVSTQRRQNGAQQQQQPAYQQQQPVYQQANMMHQQMPMMQQGQQMQPMMQPVMGGMQMVQQPMQQQQQQQRQNQAMGNENQQFAGYNMGAPMGRNI